MVRSEVPSEFQKDVPQLDGTWIYVDPEKKTREQIPIVRSSRHVYTSEYKDLRTGTVTQFELRTFVLDDQPYGQLSIRSPDFTTTFPVLLRLDLQNDRVSAAALSADFLKKNPNIVPHANLDGHILITSSGPELVNFLRVV